MFILHRRLLAVLILPFLIFDPGTLCAFAVSSLPVRINASVFNNQALEEACVAGYTPDAERDVASRLRRSATVLLDQLRQQFFEKTRQLEVLTEQMIEAQRALEEATGALRAAEQAPLPDTNMIEQRIQEIEGAIKKANSSVAVVERSIEKMIAIGQTGVANSLTSGSLKKAQDSLLSLQNELGVVQSELAKVQGRNVEKERAAVAQAQANLDAAVAAIENLNMELTALGEQIEKEEQNPTAPKKPELSQPTQAVQSAGAAVSNEQRAEAGSSLLRPGTKLDRSKVKTILLALLNVGLAPNHIGEKLVNWFWLMNAAEPMETRAAVIRSVTTDFAEYLADPAPGSDHWKIMDFNSESTLTPAAAVIRRVYQNPNIRVGTKVLHGIAREEPQLLEVILDVAEQAGSPFENLDDLIQARLTLSNLGKGQWITLTGAGSTKDTTWEAFKKPKNREDVRRILTELYPALERPIKELDEPPSVEDKTELAELAEALALLRQENQNAIIPVIEQNMEILNQQRTVGRNFLNPNTLNLSGAQEAYGKARFAGRRALLLLQELKEKHKGNLSFRDEVIRHQLEVVNRQVRILRAAHDMIDKPTLLVGMEPTQLKRIKSALAAEEDITPDEAVWLHTRQIFLPQRAAMRVWLRTLEGNHRIEDNALAQQALDTLAHLVQDEADREANGPAVLEVLQGLRSRENFMLAFGKELERLDDEWLFDYIQASSTPPSAREFYDDFVDTVLKKEPKKPDANEVTEFSTRVQKALLDQKTAQEKLGAMNKGALKQKLLAHREGIEALNRVQGQYKSLFDNEKFRGTVLIENNTLLRDVREQNDEMDRLRAQFEEKRRAIMSTWVDDKTPRRTWDPQTIKEQTVQFSRTLYATFSAEIGAEVASTHQTLLDETIAQKFSAMSPRQTPEAVEKVDRQISEDPGRPARLAWYNAQLGHLGLKGNELYQPDVYRQLLSVMPADMALTINRVRQVVKSVEKFLRRYRKEPRSWNEVKPDNSPYRYVPKKRTVHLNFWETLIHRRWHWAAEILRASIAYYLNSRSPRSLDADFVADGEAYLASQGYRSSIRSGSPGLFLLRGAYVEISADGQETRIFVNPFLSPEMQLHALVFELERLRYDRLSRNFAPVQERRQGLWGSAINQLRETPLVLRATESRVQNALDALQIGLVVPSEWKPDSLNALIQKMIVQMALKNHFLFSSHETPPSFVDAAA